ncbi:MAG: fibronectin type III domain-containing protein [Candidatus Omnitrophota bacterium]
MKKWTSELIISLLILMGLPSVIYGNITGKERRALEALYRDLNGPDWKNHKNWNQSPGSENTWHGIKCNSSNTSVIEIKLSDNNLRILDGKQVPRELEDFSNLSNLDLSSNDLTGPIPQWIGKLKNLKKLNLRNNRFTGKIASWIGELKNLEELSLEGNMLEGSIPKELGDLPNLKVLLLGSNKLVGEIPDSLLNLKRLENNKSDFKWNGLYTSNPELQEFLRKKQKDGHWEETQTLPPSDQGIKIKESTENTITINWESIKYTSDAGGYCINYWPEGKPNNKKPNKVEKKRITEFSLEKLEKSTTYYFQFQSWTDKHPKNKNKIESIRGKVFQATTRGILISGTIRDKYGKGSQGVTIKVSDESGKNIEDKTDESGKYTLSVKPNWRFSVIPSKEGLIFIPSQKNYPPLAKNQNQMDQDYMAESNITLSGRVTYNGQGVGDVTINFVGEKGNNFDTKTDAEGNFKKICPYKWSGIVKPEKEGLRFNPDKQKYNEIISDPLKEEFKVNFPSISGRVTSLRNKPVPEIILRFSNIKFPFLKELSQTDIKGNYENDVPSNWSGGSVRPESPAKKRYVFYPKIRDHLTAEDHKRAVDFKAERDFKIFILFNENIIIPKSKQFKEIYKGPIFSSELIAGFKFSRNLFVWGSGDLLSKTGKTVAFRESTKWGQQNLGLGLGYWSNLSIHFALIARIEGLQITYNEEALGEKVSGKAFGWRIDAAVICKFWSRLFTGLSLCFVEVSISYLNGKDILNETPIQLGSLRIGMGFGIRF